MLLKLSASTANSPELEAAPIRPSVTNVKGGPGFGEAPGALSLWWKSLSGSVSFSLCRIHASLRRRRPGSKTSRLVGQGGFDVARVQHHRFLIKAPAKEPIGTTQSGTCKLAWSMTHSCFASFDIQGFNITCNFYGNDVWLKALRIVQISKGGREIRKSLHEYIYI